MNKIVPSLFFVNLVQEYLAEIADLGVDAQGDSKEALAQHIAERRAEFSSLLPMIGSNPEMLASCFFGMKLPKALGEQIIACEYDALPSWDSISSQVTFPPECNSLVFMVEEEQFFVIVAGLEWARQNTKLISLN